MSLCGSCGHRHDDDGDRYLDCECGCPTFVFRASIGEPQPAFLGDPNYSDPRYTTDCVKVTAGLRVCTNELRWGNVVEPVKGVTGARGWWWVRYDDGSRAMMDGTRLAVKTPLSEDPRGKRPRSEVTRATRR